MAERFAANDHIFDCPRVPNVFEWIAAQNHEIGYKSGLYVSHVYPPHQSSTLKRRGPERFFGRRETCGHESLEFVVKIRHPRSHPEL